MALGGQVGRFAPFEGFFQRADLGHGAGGARNQLAQRHQFAADFWWVAGKFGFDSGVDRRQTLRLLGRYLFGCRVVATLMRFSQ